MSSWTGIEDGMPEIGQKVLIEIPVCGHFNIENGEYIGGGVFYGAWCSKRGNGECYKVSRWMPIPE